MQQVNEGFRSKPVPAARAGSRIARFSREMAAASVLILSALIANPACAQNPMDASGAASVAYLDCVLKAGVSKIDEALVALVDKCGHKIDQPIEEFVAQTLAALPDDPKASISEQLAPVRKLYTAQQFYYFTELDGILQTSKSIDELGVRLAELEKKALDDLGRSPQDLKVLEALAVAQYGFEFASHYGESGFAAKGFWRVLGRIARIVGAVVVGTVIAGPVGAAVCGWAMMGLISTEPL